MKVMVHLVQRLHTYAMAFPAGGLRALIELGPPTWPPSTSSMSSPPAAATLHFVLVCSECDGSRRRRSGSYNSACRTGS
jgi:hypothetical protein